MSPFPPPTEERLAARLADLPPVPQGWVDAAKAMPAARAALSDVEQRILAGAEQRAALTADLEAALQRAGHVPTTPLVRALRHLDH